VVYNVADRHLVTVTTVVSDVYKRTEGANLDRWPYAFRTEPGVISPRGPRFNLAPRGQASHQRIDEELLAARERHIRLNRG
jgi:hypothetical protein